jgi:hypothetical protein
MKRFKKRFLFRVYELSLVKARNTISRNKKNSRNTTDQNFSLFGYIFSSAFSLVRLLIHIMVNRVDIF